MIFAFLYSAERHQHDGGCNDLLGCYEDKDVAIVAALDMADEKFPNAIIIYLDLLYTEPHQHVEHYRRRCDERAFHFYHQYPVSHSTQRNTDGGNACPY